MRGNIPNRQSTDGSLTVSCQTSKVISGYLPMVPVSPGSIYQKFRACFVLSHSLSLLLKVVMGNDAGQHDHCSLIPIVTFNFPNLLCYESLNQDSTFSHEIIDYCCKNSTNHTTSTNTSWECHIHIQSVEYAFGSMQLK